MTTSGPLIQNISDTARWVAFFRAQETARKDALFRDPFAARLAGERGAEMARAMGSNTWSWMARTWLFDNLITRCVGAGTDTVVNLAAGLDARPYRMALPSSLRWIEVDLPDILAEKERLLADDRPVCRLERVPLDLGDVTGRRALFARIGSQAGRALVLLSAVPSFWEWGCDLASPGLLRLAQRKLVREVHVAVPLHFGPAERPLFFEPHGWKPVEVSSFLKTAARLGRLSLALRLVALLPESSGRQGGRP